MEANVDAILKVQEVVDAPGQISEAKDINVDAILKVQEVVDAPGQISEAKDINVDAILKIQEVVDAPGQISEAKDINVDAILKIQEVVDAPGQISEAKANLTSTNQQNMHWSIFRTNVIGDLVLPTYWNSVVNQCLYVCILYVIYKKKCVQQ